MAGKTTKRRWRLILRCCFLAAAVTLVLPLVPWTSGAMLPAVSPFVAVCSAIALRSFSAVALIALPVLLLSLLRRRWFCRNACPLGVLTEQMGRVRRPSRSHVAKWPPVGRWIALVTLAGACFGYPLLLWLDPLAIFSSYFGLCWQPVSAIGLVAGLALPVVLLISMLWRGAWCRKLCPLGATQELLAAPRRWLLRLRKSKETPVVATAPRVRRRSVLAAGLGAVALGVGAVWGRFTTLKTSGSKPKLRPPGSADESRFSGLCIRCGNCIRVCPERILRPSLIEGGVAGFLTPIVAFGDTYCRRECNLCTQVCPSGAIARLSLPEKEDAPIGLAVVDMERCLMNEASCELCISICPYNEFSEPDDPDALGTKWDNETYEAKIVINTEKCVGCGACEVVCRDVQFDGNPAIWVVPRKADQEPPI